MYTTKKKEEEKRKQKEVHHCQKEEDGKNLSADLFMNGGDDGNNDDNDDNKDNSKAKKVKYDPHLKLNFEVINFHKFVVISPVRDNPSLSSFLIANKGFYIRVCLSVHPSVHPSVCPSVHRLVSWSVCWLRIFFIVAFKPKSDLISINAPAQRSRLILLCIRAC